MNKRLKPQYLPQVCLAAGLVCLALQGLMFLSLDGKGLVASRSPFHILAWALSLGVLILCGTSLRPLAGSSRYADNFPASTLGAAGSFLLAGAIAVSIPGRAVRQASLLDLLGLALAVLAAVGLVFTGLCRLRGKHPSFWFHGAVCLFFAVHLVRSCRAWSSEPQLETYGFALFALVALMLQAYYRAAFDAGIGRRRMQLFTGLAAGLLCLAAIPGSQDKLLLLCGSLWAVTNLCVLTPHHRRRRPEAPADEAAP